MYVCAYSHVQYTQGKQKIEARVEKLCLWAYSILMLAFSAACDEKFADRDGVSWT